MADIVKKVDRGIPPTARTQNFTKGEVNTGDVIKVEDSLGHPARHVRIECTGGATGVRFNVYNTVFKRDQGAGIAGAWGSGIYGNEGNIMAGSGQQYKDSSGARFDVETNTTLAMDDFPVRDIEILASSGNFDIVVW